MRSAFARQRPMLPERERERESRRRAASYSCPKPFQTTPSNSHERENCLPHYFPVPLLRFVPKLPGCRTDSVGGGHCERDIRGGDIRRAIGPCNSQRAGELCVQR